MIDDATRNGNDSIVSWQPHGKSFRIHKGDEFAASVLPRHFNKTKFRSFQRQLHIYGFQRITDKLSPDYGAYYHALFQRGEESLCFQMTRQKIKGLSSKKNKSKAREDQPKNELDSNNSTPPQRMTSMSLNGLRAQQRLLEPTPRRNTDQQEAVFCSNLSLGMNSSIASTTRLSNMALQGLLEPIPLSSMMFQAACSQHSSNVEWTSIAQKVITHDRNVGLQKIEDLLEEVSSRNMFRQPISDNEGKGTSPNSVELKQDVMLCNEISTTLDWVERALKALCNE
jgi:hypothetical protein